jgi:hypothetical protein
MPLADVPAGARVAFLGVVYETEQNGKSVEIRETGEVLQRVRRTIRRGAEHLVEVTVRTERGDHRIVGTPEHPFYVPARCGFVPMGKLVPGMCLLGEGGRAAEVVAVDVRAASSEVFNIEVERTHTYFVCGGLESGCELVHNDGACFPRQTLRGVSLKWLERNKPRGWRTVPADKGSGWKWIDENGRERLRFMRPTGRNPGSNKWSRQANGYLKWNDSQGNFLDIDGNVLPGGASAGDLPGAHIMYEGPR